MKILLLCHLAYHATGEVDHERIVCLSSSGLSLPDDVTAWLEANRISTE